MAFVIHKVGASGRSQLTPRQTAREYLRDLPTVINEAGILLRIRNITILIKIKSEMKY